MGKLLEMPRPKLRLLKEKEGKVLTRSEAWWVSRSIQLRAAKAIQVQ